MRITIKGKSYLMGCNDGNGFHSWNFDEFFITGNFDDRSSWRVEELGDLDDWGAEEIVAEYTGSRAISIIGRLAKRYRLNGLAAESENGGKFLTFGFR